MTGIIDYGVGNLFSLRSSFAAVGEEAQTVSDPECAGKYDRLLLPGVGAFGDAAEKLRRGGMDAAVREFAASGKPLLGVCLGMQLLFERGYEYGVHDGLGLLPGEIRPIRPVIGDALDVPHIGWNALHFPADKPRHAVFAGTDEGEHVYFVHSFAAFGCGEALIAETEYGARLTAAAARDNVIGMQFHPEKSGRAGLALLRSFCAL